MTRTAQLLLNGKQIDLPVVEGTEKERAVDIGSLRSKSGYITLDDGYSNTGACRSNITYIDGEKGVLRYRGIPIEQLAQYSSFIETAMLVIWGELPTESRYKSFRKLLAEHEMIHEGLRNSFDGFPASAHPMAILSAMINAVSCYSPELMSLNGESSFEEAAARLMSKVRTIAAAAYKSSIGQPIEYPKPELDYCANFLHMMFSIPNQPYEATPEVLRALNMVLILHADHEQNCSTSTVRMVASAGANLFASCAAGVCALWGPLHGGANVAVIEMLEQIRREKISLTDYVALVKDKSSGRRLMGFGHRVYKNFDPRAVILKEAAEKLLAALHVDDPLLDIARQLEEVSLHDPYFIERKLYANVDFYSGIILRAIGIPVNMFTVMFAIARVPGWIAHWKEVHNDPNSRISRPRQIYTGPAKRDYIQMHHR
ncbi:MAG: citrate synthase [Tepidisphaeraceae bacterium]|jgi:citrate synthase